MTPQQKARVVWEALDRKFRIAWQAIAVETCILGAKLAQHRAARSASALELACGRQCSVRGNQFNDPELQSTAATCGDLQCKIAGLEQQLVQLKNNLVRFKNGGHSDRINEFFGKLQSLGHTYPTLLFSKRALVRSQRKLGAIALNQAEAGDSFARLRDQRAERFEQQAKAYSLMEQLVEKRRDLNRRLGIDSRVLVALVFVGIVVASLLAVNRTSENERRVGALTPPSNTTNTMRTPTLNAAQDNKPRPPPPDMLAISRNATWNYWQGLSVILAKEQAFEDAMERAKSNDERIAVIQAMSGKSTGLESEVNTLPVLNVDEEVTVFASELVGYYGQSSTMFDDLARLVRETKEFTGNANSVGTGLESFIRGFFGDPLGKHDELNAAAQQLEARRIALRDRIRALRDKEDQLKARQLAIRADLTRKYSKEFP